MGPQKSKRKEICERSEPQKKKLKIIAEEILDFLDVGVWKWIFTLKECWNVTQLKRNLEIK